MLSVMALTSPRVALHQQEAAPRGSSEQRDLPGDAALGVGVIVELVHHHVVDVGVLPPRAGRCSRGSRPCST